MQKTETSHFWLGRFSDEKRAAAYIDEVYDEEDEDRDHTPLSEFARDQGEKWYNHDYMECSFDKDATSVSNLIEGASYSEQWAAELSRRATADALNTINLLIFINKDQIDEPRSAEGNGYSLHYMGTIEYRI